MQPHGGIDIPTGKRRRPNKPEPVPPLTFQRPTQEAFETMVAKRRLDVLEDWLAEAIEILQAGRHEGRTFFHRRRRNRHTKNGKMLKRVRTFISLLQRAITRIRYGIKT